MYLAISLFVAVIACETKEAPSLTCKKMDQAGTTCLDNAQVSAPATAAGTGSGGMTQAQMMQLITMLRSQQQSGSLPTNATMSQTVATTEEQLNARRLGLVQDNIRLKGENASDLNNAQKVSANNIKIEQNEEEIRSIDKRLELIAEARKQPGFLDRIGNEIVGECVQNLGPCSKVAWKGLKGAGSFILSILGGDDTTDDTSNITIK